MPRPNTTEKEQSASERAERGKTMRLIGFDAIDYAEQTGLALNKSANSDPAAYRLTIAEAEAIAMEDPQRIWLHVPDDDPLVAY